MCAIVLVLEDNVLADFSFKYDQRAEQKWSAMIRRILGVLRAALECLK